MIFKKNSPLFSYKRLLIELCVIFCIQLLPRYFVTPGKLESISVLGLNVFLLFLYIIWNNRFLLSLPKPVLLLSFSHFLCVGGYFTSNNLADILFPIRDAFFTLAIMGIFSRKFCDQRHVRIIAIACVILTPLVIWQSILRNEVPFFGSSESRTGLNLIGYFSLILTAYSLLLLPYQYKIFAVIPLILVIISSSRASFFGTIIFLTVFLFTGTHNRFIRLIKSLFAVSGLSIVLCCNWLIFNQYLPELPEAVYRANRLLNIFDIDRTLVWSFWLDFLVNNYSFFGHGIATYSFQHWPFVPPHNTFLHIFNGGGIFAGFFYILACIWILRTLYKARYYSSEALFSFGLILVVLFRGFFEIEIVGQSCMHIMSIFMSYGIGVGIATFKYRKSISTLPKYSDLKNRNALL